MSERWGPRRIEGERLADWRVLFDALHARFRTPSYDAGLRLVARVGEAAATQDHHPDLDLRYGWLGVRLTSHDVGGVTERDVRLARTISAVAAEEGATADTADVQVVELALDTADASRVTPFWAAVLGLVESRVFPDELVDPRGLLPTLWFQPTEPHEPPRQRFHLDVRVPPEVAEDRVAAALAAGGELVSDAHAPTFWVLADPDGNKACVTTWRGRDDDDPTRTPVE